jgi:hypothetical protein
MVAEAARVVVVVNLETQKHGRNFSGVLVEFALKRTIVHGLEVDHEFIQVYV